MPKKRQVKTDFVLNTPPSGYLATSLTQNRNKPRQKSPFTKFIYLHKEALSRPARLSYVRKEVPNNFFFVKYL